MKPFENYSYLFSATNRIQITVGNFEALMQHLVDKHQSNLLSFGDKLTKLNQLIDKRVKFKGNTVIHNKCFWIIKWLCLSPEESLDTHSFDIFDINEVSISATKFKNYVADKTDPDATITISEGLLNTICSAIALELTTWEEYQEANRHFLERTKWHLYFVKTDKSENFRFARYTLDIRNNSDIRLYTSNHVYRSTHLQIYPESRFKKIEFFQYKNDKRSICLFLNGETSRRTDLMEVTMIHLSGEGIVYSNMAILSFCKDYEKTVNEGKNYGYFDTDIDMPSDIRSYLSKVETNRQQGSARMITSPRTLRQELVNKDNLHRPYLYEVFISTPIASLINDEINFTLLKKLSFKWKHILSKFKVYEYSIHSRLDQFETFSEIEEQAPQWKISQSQEAFKLSKSVIAFLPPNSSSRVISHISWSVISEPQKPCVVFVDKQNFKNNNLPSFLSPEVKPSSIQVYPFDYSACHSLEEKVLLEQFISLPIFQIIKDLELNHNQVLQHSGNLENKTSRKAWLISKSVFHWQDLTK